MGEGLIQSAQRSIQALTGQSSADSSASGDSWVAPGNTGSSDGSFFSNLMHPSHLLPASWFGKHQDSDSGDGSTSSSPQPIGSDGHTQSSQKRADVKQTPQNSAADSSHLSTDNSGLTQPTADGVLTLKYGDGNLDKTIAQQNYDTLKIDTPNDVQLRNWADQNGYYFWFQDANGNSVDGQKHYYPLNAKQICVNGKMYDLEAQRLKCNEDMANYNTNRTYFENLDQKNCKDPTQAVAFASRLSTLSGGILAAEEAVLTDSAKTSANPYFKIYLADVYTAQAMQPLVDQFKATGHVDLSNPQTRQRLQMAVDALKAAAGDSNNGLRQKNASVFGNTAMPLDPYDIYVDPNKGYYGFWAGAYDQAMYREASLTALQNLIQTNALSSVLHNIELP